MLGLQRGRSERRRAPRGIGAALRLLWLRVPIDSEQAPTPRAEGRDTGKLAEPLAIADAPERGQAWLPSLDGRWFRCTAEHNGGPLWLNCAEENIADGMSGSPIVANDGSAIGVVCTGNESDVDPDSGPQPRLAYNLPVGVLAKAIERLGLRRRAAA
jgi:hypothetical protein